MAGANTFRTLGEIRVRSYQSKPEVKLFRAGERVFAGVTAYSSKRSTYAPDADVFFPSRNMAIYEIKDGKAIVISQEENCYGLSQIIDGVTVYATY